MKNSSIIKILGSMHFALGSMLIGMLVFGGEMWMEQANINLKTLKAIQGTADVVGASHIGIGLLLFFCSSIKDLNSIKKVLVGELGLMACMLCVALFNTFSTYWAPELPGYNGPPPPFWFIIVLNPVLCIYGYYKGK